jgi:hypothetical protein
VIVAIVLSRSVFSVAGRGVWEIISKLRELRKVAVKRVAGKTRSAQDGEAKQK